MRPRLTTLEERQAASFRRQAALIEMGRNRRKILAALHRLENRTVEQVLRRLRNHQL
jgi:hypothetical protein